MDIYQIVTDKILAALDQGIIPWKKPWCSVTGGAFNRVTRKPYSLLNQMLLQRDGEYATIKQWNREGGKIHKGEKSELVVFWKWPEKSDDDSEAADEQTNNRPVLRYYRVFHVSQVEGVEPLKTLGDLFTTDSIPLAERVFRDYVNREGIRLEEELSDRAYYAPTTDTIHIPSILQFRNAEQYYSTAFHEAVHASGNANRLNRIGIQNVNFGSETYSKEELIAEIGAAFLLHAIGIESEKSDENSVAYIQSWMSALQKDKRLIVSAASQAEKAVRLIMGEMHVSQ